MLPSNYSNRKWFEPESLKNHYLFLGSLVCPPCEDVCEGKPPSLTSSAKTLSGHGGVADRYRRITIYLMKRYIYYGLVSKLINILQIMFITSAYPWSQSKTVMDHIATEENSSASLEYCHRRTSYIIKTPWHVEAAKVNTPLNILFLQL